MPDSQVGHTSVRLRRNLAIGGNFAMRNRDFYDDDPWWGRNLTEDEHPQGLLSAYEYPVDLPDPGCPLHERICPRNQTIKQANGHHQP
jgi:hypothetical protein